MTRHKLLIAAAVLIGVFLLGFLPPHLRARRLQAELTRTSWQLQEARLVDLIAFAYIQTAQRNFGLAAETSTRFFDRVGEMIERTPNPDQRQALLQISGYRDRVTSELAQADPAVMTTLQDLYMRTRAAAVP